MLLKLGLAVIQVQTNILRYSDENKWLVQAALDIQARQ